MPKAYTQGEREHITASLKAATMECVTRYGVRKTTVDELVRRAGIPKGTFYLFYASKELLLFSALTDVHDRIQAQLVEDIRTMGTPTVDSLTAYILKYCRMLDDSNLAPLFVDGELEALMRKLPEEEVRAHFAHDHLSLEQLAALLPGAKQKNLPAFEGALRAVFLTTLYKREIGAEHYAETLEILVRGVVAQLLE